ncbi:MAG TPA: hypothetical protein VFN42_11930 [Acetobacteraceae bacterium]|nr:hypothetical protein [Acetobacteraceae bacterium]
MRKTVIAAVTALAVTGLGAGTLVANAQPAPPPGPPAGPGFGGPPGPHPHWHAWMHHRGEEHRPFAPGTFALVHRQADRHLSPSDVQTIAQAFLLWNGNHSWKVVDVAPGPDGKIGFAYATQQGGVIARFTMDPHNGHVARVD